MKVFHYSRFHYGQFKNEAFTPKIETIVKEELGRAFRDLLKRDYPD